MIAVLFAEPRGIYSKVPDVDLWCEQRDARLYAGPWPVVAHPPCARWCQLAGLVEARWGHRRGEDGGCFEAALAAVRRWGGVLEHPAYTAAWPTFGLPDPDPRGGWQGTLCGGWVCHVEQLRYGHRARKATWLYAHGVRPPTLRWGCDGKADALVGFCRNRIAAGDQRKHITKKARNATPPAFAEVLLAIARSVQPRGIQNSAT